MEPGSTFDPQGLVLAFTQLSSSAWGQPVAATEPTNPGYRIASLITGGHRKQPAGLFRWVLDEFAPVWSAWVAEVPAHGHIGLHIDEGPYRERWHVPIVAAGTFNGYTPEAGVSFRVRQWEPHRVDNSTDRARIHLVIDRDVLVDVPPVMFQRIEEP